MQGQSQKIAFVTDKATVPEYDNIKTENGKLVAFLKEKGFFPSCQVWDDQKVNWADFDAVIVKTPWDYHKRIVEFQAWLCKLEKVGAYVLNPVDVMRWNSDKIYLREMEEKGVRIAPTLWLGQGDKFDVERIFAELKTDKIIVKPRVSASANHTYALTKEEAVAKKDNIERLLQDHCFMAQPFLKEVQTKGEWSLLFFGGKFSHSILKTPKESDFRVQGHFGGTVHKLEAPVHLVETAQRIMDLFGKSCLYVRVDGLEVDGEFVLMEFEAIEPYFFLLKSDKGAELFYEALVDRLESKSKEN